MEDTLYAPSADVKTTEAAAPADDAAASQAATEKTTTPSEGMTAQATVAPFIVPAPVADKTDGDVEESKADVADASTKDKASDATTDHVGDPAKSGDDSDGVEDRSSVSEAEDAGDGAVVSPEAPLDKTEVATGPLSGEHKAQVVLKALKNIEQSIHNLIVLLEADAGVKTTEVAKEMLMDVAQALPNAVHVPQMEQTDGGRVIEGVFNGHNMVGSDGKIYSVPPNYASKSKLVEGDLLKLTITPKGSFIYKQIGPIERSRVIGALGFDHTNGEWYAATDNRRWSVIKASVTYFKGEPGDEIVLLIPKNEPSKWAAVENIIKKDPLV